MSTYTAAFRRAIESFMCDAMSASLRGPRNREELSLDVEAFLTALSAGQAPESTMTPFQQRMYGTVALLGARTDEFIAAIARPEDHDAAARAMTELIGALMGQVLALEARLAALEITTTGS